MKSKNDIEVFEKVQSQIKALHEEIGILSKKKPDDGINKFKLKLVNNVLAQANKLLCKKYKPFPDFELFEMDRIPTNSDVVIILAQYLNCMEKLRSDNIKIYHGTWQWFLNGQETGIETSSPKKLTER